MLQSANWSVIVNPSAKGGKALEQWEKLEQVFKQQGIAYVLSLTTKPGDAVEIVQERILAGNRQVLVVGGDGSLNEVVNGLLSQNEVPTTEVKLAVFPAGTGNDFVKTWQIPSDAEDFAEMLNKGETCVQDAGQIVFPNSAQPTHYFLNVAGIGFDALVAHRANTAKIAGKSGLLTYIKALVGSLTAYRAVNCRVSIDDRHVSYPVFTVLAGIGKFAGSGMKLVPDAVANDGFFHVTAVRKISKLKIVFNLLRLFSGKFTHFKEVDVLVAKQVKVFPDSGLFVQADGESLGEGPVEFRILPGRIQVVVPK